MYGNKKYKLKHYHQAEAALHLANLDESVSEENMVLNPGKDFKYSTNIHYGVIFFIYFTYLWFGIKNTSQCKIRMQSAKKAIYRCACSITTDRCCGWWCWNTASLF